MQERGTTMEAEYYDTENSEASNRPRFQNKEVPQRVYV